MFKSNSAVSEIAYSLLTNVKAANDGEKETVITGIATTPTPDRVGDIVEPLGVTFVNPMPLLWQHRASEPVGTVEFGAPTKSGIPFTARLPVVTEPGKLKDRVDEARQSVKLGLVRAVSIGFRALEYSFMDEGGIRFTKSEVYELSLVTIPAQAEATIASVKSHATADLLASSGAKLIGSKKPGVSGNSTSLRPPATAKNKEVTPMDWAKLIADAQAAKSLKQERMNELLGSSDGLTLDEAGQKEYDGLDAEVDALDEQVKRLEKAQARDTATAKPVAGNGSKAATQSRTAPAAVAKAPALGPGIGFAQFAICLAQAKGNLMQAEQIANNRYANNAELNIAIKAAVGAGTTTDATWAAPLVDSYQRFAGDFVEFLRPQTIIGKFGTSGIPSLRRVPFNISIVGQTSGGAGYWVGEGKAKPLTKFDFNEVNLRWAKVANIAVLTEELIRFSNPAAEQLVRDGLAAALIERLDIDFIDPAKAASANVSPASITNGVTAIPSTGNDAVAVRNDVKALFGAYIAANMSPLNGVWIMSAVNALALSMMTNALGQKEFPGVSMLGGTFEGLPVIVSEYVDTDTVILANASDIYLADDGQVVIDASREASLQMDTAPTMASNPATSIETVSMFQTNSVALRAERWINWQKRRAQAVQVLSGVAWGQPEVGGGG